MNHSRESIDSQTVNKQQPTEETRTHETSNYWTSNKSIMQRQNNEWNELCLDREIARTIENIDLEN